MTFEPVITCHLPQLKEVNNKVSRKSFSRTISLAIFWTPETLQRRRQFFLSLSYNLVRKPEDKSLKSRGILQHHTAPLRPRNLVFSHVCIQSQRINVTDVEISIANCGGVHWSFQIGAMSSGNGAQAEETPRSVGPGPEGSSAASAIAGEFPLSDKAGHRVCRWRRGGRVERLSG